MVPSTHEIFGRRLRQARTMRNFSLRELAEAAGEVISHTALSKYEAGLMLPGSDVLVTLADALGQPTDYFFRPFTIELEGVRFRKKVRLKASEQKAILERARDYFERYHEAEELAGDVRVFKSPFAGRHVAAANEAEHIAAQLRQRWKLGHDPLPNIHEMMETNGIKVFEVEVEGTDFDGLSADTSAGPVVVIASHLNRNLPRKRMTSAHELAHVVVEFAPGTDDKIEEEFAKRFAGAFLLPADTFVLAFGRHRHRISLGELIDLKIQFGASIMAIMKRAEQLNLISTSAFRNFCIIANRERWRSQGEPGDDQFRGKEGDGRFRQLVLRAVAEEQISVSRGAALLDQSLSQFREGLRDVIG